MAVTKILLVDDDDLVRSTLDEVSPQEGFDVTTTASVPEALKYITSNVYDVLLSDLHMPGAGDGLTVVSAMRPTNPTAVTMLLSAFPEMYRLSCHPLASRSDSGEADGCNDAGRSDQGEAVDRSPRAPRRRDRHYHSGTYDRDHHSGLVCVYPAGPERDGSSADLRASHQPPAQVFTDLILRLRSLKSIGSKELVSPAAAEHGLNRRRRGYSAAMMVEESRMLQVSVFHTLQKNLAHIDFSILLTEVMTIAGRDRLTTEPGDDKLRGGVSDRRASDSKR